jgi:hypothetical protein
MTMNFLKQLKYLLITMNNKFIFIGILTTQLVVSIRLALSMTYKLFKD